MFSCLGPNGLILGSGQGTNAVLGSTHVVEQLSFSLIPSFLTFEFDLVLGLFFGALMDYF